MAEPPTVRVSGIVLASLMFQHLNSDCDVEGLILGESRSEEQVTISDSQADHIHIQETYNIQKHISCATLNSFSNSFGKVNVDSVKKLLADNKPESLIGWYRQRRNSEQQMTFREKAVHQNLKNSLSNPNMIFLLLTPSELTAAGSTHRIEYGAFVSRGRRFLNVPVRVSNLGVLEQLAYWMASVPCSAAGYDVTMKKHSSKFFCSNGFLREVNEVNKMNDSLQSELQTTCSAVAESERVVEALLADVAALRRRVGEKRRNGVLKADGAAEQDNNQLLQDAVRALFACSPLFCSQTLTTEAFPVPDAAQRSPAFSTDAQETLGLLRPNTSRKRLIETWLGRERKQRKSTA